MKTRLVVVALTLAVCVAAAEAHAQQGVAGERWLTRMVSPSPV